ncbi:MAG: DNA cytosine methyltransferase [Thermogutta sp.]|nr:DNA cytosine methyltransferase [Thermogutta sp.]
MSGNAEDKKRFLQVTAGNLRNQHLYVHRHLDFFPADCLAPADPADGSRGAVAIYLEGLNRTVETQLAIDTKTGKPRGFFRSRTWVREFFEHHGIQTGDVLALERTGERTYRLYPFEGGGDRRHDWRRLLEEPSPKEGPTVLELFAGAGGMALGFRRAGFQTVLANEWDAAACQTLRANITDRVAQCAIQEIERFPQADVIAGGPPCQGFSNLGDRVPFDPRNQLWREFLRAVEQVLPKAFVMENVPPILSSQEFVELKKKAESLGYRVEGRILNAADYGVPQLRKRAFVIGVRNDEVSFPPPTHADPSKVTPLLRGTLLPWKTVRDAIGDLPPEPDGRNWHIGRNPTAKSLERYRCIPAGGNRWDLPPHLMPDCWKRKTKGGTDLFGRLWWDRPSVTIRTEFYKPEKGRYLHPEAHRPITHREAARLQGFPDDYIFHGSKIEVGIQIGNAVPPPLAEAIARHLLRSVKALARPTAEVA